jgi:hypothetical protein
VTYGGSGPNSASSFSSAFDEIAIYINGDSQSLTDSSIGTYAGMPNSTHTLKIGRVTTAYAEGSIRDVKIFNRELTASEVAELARGNDLGFSEEWGDHTTEKLTDGGMESWYSGTNLTNWVEGSAVSTAQESVDIQSGTYSCELTGGGPIGSSGNNWLSQNAGIDSGKRYRFTAKVKRVSGTTNTLQIGVTYVPFVTFDGTAFTANTDATYLPESRIVSQSSLGSGWYSVTVEFVPNVGGSSLLVFGVTGPTDPYLIDDCSLVQIGTLASFSAERYDTSTNKLYDISDNAFVGTGTSVTLTGREVPVYETGTWTPSITFGGGSTGITYGAQEGYYTRIGNEVTVYGVVTLSAVGSDSGQARIAGLPFIARNTTASTSGIVVSRAANMSGLTSYVNGQITKNATTISLYDWGATGQADLLDTNFTATSSIAFSGTYQIQ